MRPGSQTLEHAATNVKEELGNSASDLAKVIAGANVTNGGIVDSGADSFVSLLSSIKSGLIYVFDYRLELRPRWRMKSHNRYWLSAWQVSCGMKTRAILSC